MQKRLLLSILINFPIAVKESNTKISSRPKKRWNTLEIVKAIDIYKWMLSIPHKKRIEFYLSPDWCICMENSTTLENYSQIQNVGTLLSGLHEQVVLLVPVFYVSFLHQSLTTNPINLNFRPETSIELFSFWVYFILWWVISKEILLIFCVNFNCSRLKTSLAWYMSFLCIIIHNKVYHGLTLQSYVYAGPVLKMLLTVIARAMKTDWK